jgi:hypothetical protein
VEKKKKKYKAKTSSRARNSREGNSEVRDQINVRTGNSGLICAEFGVDNGNRKMATSQGLRNSEVDRHPTIVSNYVDGQ